MMIPVVIVFVASLACSTGMTIRDIGNIGKNAIQFEYYPSAASSGRHRSRREVATPRVGRATNTNSCGNIREVPETLRSAANMYPNGLDEFYQKYTEAYGIPVLGSSSVSDSALQRACYVVRFVFADRYNVRNSYYGLFGRFAVMAENEVTTDIPEHSDLDSSLNQRARGLGSTPERPICTAAEENLLCNRDDSYSNEDIAIHEFAHGAHMMGAAYAIPDFDNRLQALYNDAKSAGLWQNTYALTDYMEYFAEGVQSYFGVQAYADPPDGNHNQISTREALEGYDPNLFAFIAEFFLCGNTYIKRCDKDRQAELNQQLAINCDIGAVADIPGCTDQDENCPNWAHEGECQSNPDFMLTNCRKSCNNCYISSDEAAGCTDQDVTCPFWANRGECQSNPDFMLTNCRKSCNNC